MPEEEFWEDKGIWLCADCETESKESEVDIDDSNELDEVVCPNCGSYDMNWRDR